MRLRCRLLAPAGTSTGAGARVRLTVEDVSFADRAATPVGAADIALRPGEPVGGPYEVVAHLQPGADYAIRAHVDHDGDGAVAVGDLISTGRHLVVAGPDPFDVVIPLTQVAPDPRADG